jgi:hypothetical protein
MVEFEVPASLSEFVMQSTGRCLCGSVRYTIAGAPTTVLDCHCSMCRRESGASSLVFVGYRRAEVSMGGPLKYYRSSEIAKRGFCPDCGSPICYEDNADGEFIWITAGTHDNAEALPKREHVYVDDKLPWVDIAEDLVQWPHERASKR